MCVSISPTDFHAGLSMFTDKLVMVIKQNNYIESYCVMFYLQVEVDWEKINAKVDMELKNEASRPGAKPYNGWHSFYLYLCIHVHCSAFWWCPANKLVNILIVMEGSTFSVEHEVYYSHRMSLTANTEDSLH